MDKEKTRLNADDKTKLHQQDQTHLSNTQGRRGESLTHLSPSPIDEVSSHTEYIAPDESETEAGQADMMGDTMMDDESPYPDDSGDQNPERTSALFGISDIKSKLENELANIPDSYEDELEPNQMSALIKTFFPSRSDEERLRINRHFLRDAEPFRLEKFITGINTTPSPMQTGYPSLDNRIRIPGDSLTLIVSPPRHGKTIFMLNLFLNFTRQNPEKRFIYYTYEEPRQEIFLRLINMCGTKQFIRQNSFQTNMERWKQEFREHSQQDLLEKAEAEPEYRGLKTFMELAGRMQIVDTRHNSPDLMDSIRSFKNTFPVGAFFIDSLSRLQPGGDTRGVSRSEQIQEITYQLRLLAFEVKIPIIMTAPLPAVAASAPEYDQLTPETLTMLGHPDRNADLTLGLQNYSRSRFIGSNLNPGFTSSFHSDPLQQAQIMPESIKDMMNKTVLRVKTISNKCSAETDAELIFHKQLLVISDG